MRYDIRLARRASLLLACAIGLIASAAHAETPVRWKFKEGQSLPYILDRGVEGKISLGGAEIVFKVSMIFDTDWKVKAVASDGTADVEQTIDRVQLNMSSPLGGDLTYDSSRSEEPEGPVWAQMGPMLTSMVGQTVKVKISPQGKVSDIQLSEKILGTLGKQAGGNRQQGFGMGGMNAFSEKGIKELIEKSVLPLPEAAPGKDVTWKQKFENSIPMVGTQTSETVFSFGEIEKVDGKSLQKIVAKTELTFEPVENPRADLEITEQEGTATFYFDPAAGRLVNANGVQKMSMEISGPQEVTQEITETMNMKEGKSPPAAKSESAADKKDEKK